MGDLIFKKYGDLLKNKTILITGSGRGIGKALAIGMAKLGANIILTSRNMEELNEVKKIIENDGGSAIAVKSNVQIYDEIKSIVDTALKEYSNIDVLVNNAGFSKIKPITRLRVSEYEDMIKTNILGVVHATHLVVPHMIEQKSGSIINTGSVAVFMPLPNWNVYAMTKSALLAFTTSLAEELKRFKVRVNTIMPNMVHTPMLHSGRTPEQIAALDAMQPEELIPYYAFLASDLSKKITGQNLNIDVFETLIKLKEPIIKQLASSSSEESEQAETSKETKGEIIIKWKDVEPLASEKLTKDNFKMARKSKKLVEFLMNVK
ncbi:MAG: SDR family NAD(P)-dependent oxidoreductase [Promethearchaeota archaeon]